jgi:hypothetical protein
MRAEFGKEELGNLHQPFVNREYTDQSKGCKIDAHSGSAPKPASYCQGQRRMSRVKIRSSSTTAANKIIIYVQTCQDAEDLVELARLHCICPAGGHNRRRKREKEMLDRWVPFQTPDKPLFRHHYCSRRGASTTCICAFDPSKGGTS